MYIYVYPYCNEGMGGSDGPEIANADKEVGHRISSVDNAVFGENEVRLLIKLTFNEEY